MTSTGCVYGLSYMLTRPGFMAISPKLKLFTYILLASPARVISSLQKLSTLGTKYTIYRLFMALASFLRMIELIVLMAVVIGFRKNIRVDALKSSIASVSFSKRTICSLGTRLLSLKS